jgi:phosphoenolpyruvate carboxylase
MPTTDIAALQQFKNLVGIKFQLYNSLFTSLPFHRIENTGFLIPILLLDCEEGYKKNASPSDIIEGFFAKQSNVETETAELDLLFRLTQYIERQVVLFDALEDAAFTAVHDTSGAGTLKQLTAEVERTQQQAAFTEKLNNFSAQLVLTAHPTQFYRGAVLGIINDLSNAVKSNNELQVYSYLQQLGRTPFYQQEKPTPFDEAITLVWYLENVFYEAMGNIQRFLEDRYPGAIHSNKPLVKMGFWPGGDRDGNPFVNAATTLNVGKALRQSILKCYYLDIRKLKGRLTFKGVDLALAGLEKKIYDLLFLSDETVTLTKEDMLDALLQIRDQVNKQHNGLFVEMVEALITRVQLFGLHFASLDIRQDSGIHSGLFAQLATSTPLLPENYDQLDQPSKISLLSKIGELPASFGFAEPVWEDTIESVKAIKKIQQLNGEAGCHRYIISHANSALNVMEVLALFSLAGYPAQEISVDIVPLFETIDDLQQAPEIMLELYSNEVYQKHLQQRGLQQTIMLGFSDGTKDGGYLMANWSIYQAKEKLTEVSKQSGIDVVFFDGRGGPPARGGGKTHNFYASLGKKISGKEIQLTIQGQTVSSNFGNAAAAQYNIEQLLHAGISNELFNGKVDSMPQDHYTLIQQLAGLSYDSYKALKDHPMFTEYLLHASPLRFYADTNIASRPAKRGSGKLTLNDLRAIPFVGAWSQLKQNVTGYYGVGTALQAMEDSGRLPEVKSLYKNSLFFRTLIDNCEMAMKKSFFPLTAYLSQQPDYAQIWNMLHDEYLLTRKCIAALTGYDELLATQPVDQLSIQMRERIVLPLLTIQQYALARLRELEAGDNNADRRSDYEKLVMRCSFGIINSGRNSA